MNQDIRIKLIKYIEGILTLKVWKEHNALINKDCNIPRNVYIDESHKDKRFKLLFETLITYEEAFIHHDWLLQNTIEGLSISHAYLFLKEIKNILEEDIADDKLESSLVEAYHKIKDLTDEQLDN